MQLIKLESNQPTFKTVNFNPMGLSIIVGKQFNPDSKDRTKTFNGVGKSLIIRLLHFCLGSNKIDEFANKLPDWQFSLTFKINDTEYVVTRAALEQDKVTLNGQLITNTEYKQFLADQLLQNTPKSNVTLRNVISRFLRPNKAGYSDALSPLSEESDFAKLIVATFLLGLDSDKVIEKKSLRDEKQKTITKRDNFKKDDILKDFFSGNKDPQIELIDIEEEIAKLEKSLKSFDVADDYHEVRSKADLASRQKRDIENTLFVTRNSIENIKNSLKIRSDLSKDAVVKIYEEAKFHFNTQVKKNLDDVIKFHSELIQNRKKRLSEEKDRLSKKAVKLEAQIKDLNKEVDNSLKYLNSHRALDEFVALSSKLNDLISQSQRIKDYRNMISQYEAKVQSISIDMNKANISTEKYLEQAANHVLEINSLFRSFTKLFYTNKPGGISIQNNSGDNQTRFDISVKIQDDASDGINEVKVFCFDLCLMLLQMNHLIRFIFHDSRLFSDMDPRQKATLFTLANEVTNKNKFQYICSINQDQLEAIKTELDAAQFESIIQKNIVLELTDESTESRLLGIQVDLDND
jgi:uncharacterized protein YydD (DUF2326 family)